jgi:hypothetical protein
VIFQQKQGSESQSTLIFDLQKGWNESTQEKDSTISEKGVHSQHVDYLGKQASLSDFCRNQT